MVNFLVPLGEVVLGIWLLARFWRFGAWLTALAAFTTFALLSLSLALEQRASCGCFGDYTVPPWWTFALDITIAVLLLVFCPRFKGFATRGEIVAVGRLTAVSVAIFVALVGVLMLSYGSVSRAVAAFHGIHVAVEPRPADAGELTRGEVRDIQITLTNYGTRPVQVVGVHKACSCKATGGIPVTIAVGATAAVRIGIEAPDESGRLKRTVWLMTSERPVRVDVTGRVVERAGL